MGKAILVIFLLVLVIGGGVGLYYVNKNSSFLGFSVKEEQIDKNNETTEGMTGIYDKLITKKLLVAEKYQTGVFTTDRILNLPSDFQINVFVSGLSAPRFFTFDDDNNMIVADKGAGKIFLIKDVEQDGVADKVLTVDSGLTNVHSVFYYKGDLYVGEETQISLYRGMAADGSYESKEVIVPNLPEDGNHVTRTVVVGPDGMLYVSIGSSCNVCEEKDDRRAAVMRYNLDGSDATLFAEGLRNTVGLEFYEKRLWGVENGRDLLGDDLPGEEVNEIQRGEHYGWPYCYGDGVADPGYSDKKDFCENDSKYPAYLIQAHSAPLGLSFLPQRIENSNFPIALEDNLFMAYHGSWNRTTPTGYKVARIDIKGKDSTSVNFVTGWLEKDGKAWGRPVDVGFDRKNEMYITDDQAGAIYRVSYIQE